MRQRLRPRPIKHKNRVPCTDGETWALKCSAFQRPCPRPPPRRGRSVISFTYAVHYRCGKKGTASLNALLPIDPLDRLRGCRLHRFVAIEFGDLDKVGLRPF